MKKYIILLIAVALAVIGIIGFVHYSDDAEATTYNPDQIKGGVAVQCNVGHSTIAVGNVSVGLSNSQSLTLFSYSLDAVYGGDQYCIINNDSNLFLTWERNTDVTMYWQAESTWDVSEHTSSIDVYIWLNSATKPNNAIHLNPLNSSAFLEFVSISVTINGSGNYGSPYGNDTTVVSATNLDYPSVTTSVTGSNLTDWDCTYSGYVLTFNTFNAYGTVSESTLNIPVGSSIWYETPAGLNPTVSYIYIRYPDNSTYTVTATANTATVEYEYAFVEWSNNVTTTATAITADMTITATFQRMYVQYTVTITPTSWGQVTYNSVTVDYGTIPSISASGKSLTLGVTTVQAVPNADTAQYDYGFAEWQNVPEMITSDVTITAVFSRTVQEYTVSIVSNDENLGTVDIDSVVVPYGTIITGDALNVNQLLIDTDDNHNTWEVVITATPSEDTVSTQYWLRLWLIPNFTVHSDTTVTAVFESGVREYLVSFVSNGAYGNVDYANLNVGYGTAIIVSDNTVTLDGTTVTATPIPATQQYTYSFSEWDGVTATVEGDMTIEAVFERSLTPYIITFIVNKPEYGSWSESSLTVPYGTEVTRNGRTVTLGDESVRLMLTPANSMHSYRVVDYTGIPQEVTQNATITANLACDNTMDAFNIIQPEQSLEETTRQKEGAVWSLVLVLPIFVIISLIIFAVKFGRHDDYNDF